MKASDGWWTGLVNQQQHIAAVCLSLPGSPGSSVLSDGGSGWYWLRVSSQSYLVATVMAERASDWTVVDVVAK